MYLFQQLFNNNNDNCTWKTNCVLKLLILINNY